MTAPTMTYSEPLRVVGIDPGPIPGLVVLDLEPTTDGTVRWLREASAFQCTANAAAGLLRDLLVDGAGAALVQVETYVVGGKSGKLASARESAETRDLVGALEQVVRAHHRGPISGQTGTFVQRAAGQVKPWATEARLAKARLLEPTKGMRHARDGGKHALFAAVHDGGLPDPLSRSWAAR